MITCSAVVKFMPANERLGVQSPTGPDFFALSLSVCQFDSASSQIFFSLTNELISCNAFNQENCDKHPLLM